MNIIKKPLFANATPTLWDPYRAMRDIIRWSPLAQLEANADLPSVTFNPNFEVTETKEGYQFRADLPGIKEKDLEIAMTGNQLTVSGHREEEKTDENDRYYVHERSYGSFMRAFTLPEGTDANKIVAELKNGVLNMLIPRRPEAQPHKITVKATH